MPFRHAIPFLFAVLALAACSTTVSSSGDATIDAVADAVTGVDARDIPVATDASRDAGTSACPLMEPTSPWPCNNEGLECEYGTDPRRECRDVATCVLDNWQIRHPSTTGFNAAPWCASPPPAAMCPATAMAADGMSCSASGAVCTYDGTLCECTPCVSFPLPTCMQPPRWLCDTTPTGCPTASPRFGEPCSTEGLSCDYGCNSPDGVAQCTNGVWQMGSHRDCPISTREAKHDIAYLTPSQVDAIARSLRTMHLATWRYNRPELGARQHLGFILEDQPGSFAADPEHRQVDLYGFASMLAATVQSQDREIQSLRQRLDALERRH